VPNGLDVVDCGRHAGNQHGFIPRHTKTDNFKVGETNNLEIDVTFFNDATGQPLDNRTLTWTDSLGSTNTKHSYYNPSTLVNHFAHIEAVEDGTHTVTVDDQPGCKVLEFFCELDSCGWVRHFGPGSIDINIKKNERQWTHYLGVYCDVGE